MLELKSKFIKDIDAHNLMDSMFNKNRYRYDIVILTTKRGYCFVDAFRNSFISSSKNNSPIIHSDKFLDTPEFMEFIKNNQCICVFDDIVRYGRKLTDICRKIRDIYQRKGFAVKIDVKVIVSYSNFDPTLLKIRDFKSASICNDMVEINEAAFDILCSLYRKQYPIAIGAPKTSLIKNDLTNITNTCVQLGLKKLTNCNMSVLDDLEISLYEKYLDIDELRTLYGNVLGTFMSGANIEMYVYSTPTSSAQIVSRAYLSRISLLSLDRILLRFCEMFANTENKHEFNNIMGAKPTLKYEWINFILSVLVLYGIHNNYIIDTTNLEEHYGAPAAKMIRQAVNSLKDNYDFTQKRIISVFDNIGDSLLENITQPHYLDQPYIELLEKVFKNVEKSCVTISKYYHMQSHLEVRINNYENRFPRKIIDMPVYNLIRFFKSDKKYYSCETDIRRELVHSQIEGKVSMVTNFSKDSKNVEKYTKIGEVGAGLLPQQNISVIGLDLAERIYEKFETDLISEKKRYKNLLKNSVINSPNKNTDNITYVKDGDMVEQQLLELGKLWNHMDAYQLQILPELEDSDICFLHTVFVEKREREIDVNGEYVLNEIATEDMAFALNKKSTLLIRVCSRVKYDNGKLVKKVFLADPQYVWILDNYDESKHIEFNKKIEEIFFQKLLEE